MAEKPPIDQEVTDNDRLMGLLSYVIGVIVPLIILLSEAGKTRAFQRYHAIQSLGFSVAYFVFVVLVSICGCLFATVVAALSAGVGSVLYCCLLPLSLLPWLVAIYYGIRAYQGEYVSIPVLTDFMTNQGWL